MSTRNVAIRAALYAAVVASSLAALGWHLKDTDQVKSEVVALRQVAVETEHWRVEMLDQLKGLRQDVRDLK